MRMLAYIWPGNLDELRELAERLAHIENKKPITIADLPERIRLIQSPGGGAVGDLGPLLSSIELPEGGVMLPGLVSLLETTLITSALERADGVQKEAARLLGLKRTTLIEKMKKKGIA